jgi:hypothetical protein
MRHLPLDERGYPIPFFVTFIDGAPDFRVVDDVAMVAAINQRRCWICGSTLRSLCAFTVGPMCAINRISAEPPSHPECAEYAVKACPFMVMPKMVRRTNDLPESVRISEFNNPRNPGVMLMWLTRKWDIVEVNKGLIFNMGSPTAVFWFTRGRPATRLEALKSFSEGGQILCEAAGKEGPDAVNEFDRRLIEATKFLPRS